MATALHDAIRKGSEDAVAAALSSGGALDVNAQHQGRTALHMAAAGEEGSLLADAGTGGMHASTDGAIVGKRT